MSDGGRCAKHDNWHAHCQQCCREEVAALRAQVATLTAELHKASDIIESMQSNGIGFRDAVKTLRKAIKSVIRCGYGSAAWSEALKTAEAALDTTKLTRLKARGPSRFVSVEKVREAAMKAAESALFRPRQTGEVAEGAWQVYERKAKAAAIVDALLAEVTT